MRNGGELMADKNFDEWLAACRKYTEAEPGDTTEMTVLRGLLREALGELAHARACIKDTAAEMEEAEQALFDAREFATRALRGVQ